MLWKKLNKEKGKDSESNNSGSPLPRVYTQQKNIAQKDHNLVNEIKQEDKEKKRKMDWYKKYNGKIEYVYEEINGEGQMNNKNGESGKNQEMKIKKQNGQNTQYYTMGVGRVENYNEAANENCEELQQNQVTQLPKTSKFICQNQNQTKVYIEAQDCVNYNDDNQQKLDQGQTSKNNSTFSKKQFVSISLGKAKAPKNMKLQVDKSSAEQSLNTSKKKEDEQPLIMYSDMEFNDSQSKPSIKVPIKSQDKNLEKEHENEDYMQDFVEQMREAGVDISDLYSNTRSREASLQFVQSKQTKNNNNPTNTQQKAEREASFRLTNNSFEYVQKININQKKMDEINKIDNKINISKLRYLEEIVEQYKQMYLIGKKYIENMISDCYLHIDRISRLIFDKLVQFEKSKCVKYDQNQIIENLRHRVLCLQAELLEKQVLISKQNQAIEDYKSKNQQLSQNLFDSTQKIAQIECEITQRVQQMVLKMAQKSKPYNSEQMQIQRLSQQVEQLTRLYENSQHQHKITLQQQKMALTIELQKLARKQTGLYQRQMKIQQEQFALKQQEKRLIMEEEKIARRQEEVNQIERNLSDKLLKVQKLEEELNDGFAYLDEVKRENQQQVEIIQKEKEQLLRQLEKCQQRIANLQKWESYLNQRQNQLEAKSHAQPISPNKITRSKQFVKYLSSVEDRKNYYTQANEEPSYQLDLKKFERKEPIRSNQYYELSSTDRVPYKSTHNLMQVPKTNRNGNNNQKYTLKNNRYSKNNYEDMFDKIAHKSSSGEKHSSDFRRAVVKSPIASIRNSKPINQIPLQSVQSVVHYGKKSALDSREWKGIKSKYGVGQKSPGSRQSSKLSELDSKIQILRKQIKRQIHAALDN